MKTKLRTNTFAQVVGGFHDGQVVLLGKRSGSGYFCQGKGLYTFDGWISHKMLQPLSSKKKHDIEQMLKSAKEEVVFYGKALDQLNK